MTVVANKQVTILHSLNDCLHFGSPSFNDLSAIIFHFWQHIVIFSFSADIEKAFLHVLLDECTRFLWLSNFTDKNSLFVTYRFRVVLFGATSSNSPFMFHATLTFHLTQNIIVVSQDLLHNLYVDNYSVWMLLTNKRAGVEYFIGVYYTLIKFRMYCSQ